MKRTLFSNRILWILLATIIWYLTIGAYFDVVAETVLDLIRSENAAFFFINEMYTSTIGAAIILAVLLYVFKNNRPILRSFLPDGNRKYQTIKSEDQVTYVGSQKEWQKVALEKTKADNRLSKLGYGLLLGFLTNFACILCALIHGDIKLIFDFSANQIPLLIYALLAVFIQSSSEELWCRGYMYEKINVHYPLWVAAVVNGVFFGLIHMFNPGVSVLAIADIIVCGIAYSLLRWYSGSIWTCMGIHTAWNFTQNFLFGLPNSGLVSEMSVFHLDAFVDNGSWIYDYSFGVEGGVPAVLVDLLLAVVILILAKRDGRLGELFMTKEKECEPLVIGTAEQDNDREVIEI